MIIIIFLLATLQKVLSYSIKENTFSDRLLNTNSFYNSNYFTYSNYFLYSNAFKYSSNFLYSNAFNSNSYINSIDKISNFYITQIGSLSQTYSITSYTYYSSIKGSNLYITQIGSLSLTYIKSSHVYSVSFNPIASLTLIPTLMPTLMPTLIPTVMPTLIPTLIPTVMPTQSLTLIPTIYTNSYLKFETSMTLSGFTQPILDDNFLLAIVLSIAHSANISSNYVSIKEYSFVNSRRRLTFTLKNLYNLLLVSQIIIPLTNNNNNNNNIILTSLYTSLTTNIQNSISSGSFITYLLSQSALLNASISNINISVSNYTISKMNIVNNVPTSYPTSFDYDGNSVENLSDILIIKIVLITIAVFIVILFIFSQVLKRYNNYHIPNITPNRV